MRSANPTCRGSSALFLYSSAACGAAGLSADRLTRYHQFNPAVDLPALSRVVGAHRLGFTESLGGDRTRQNALGYQIGAHGLRALVGEVLVVFVAPTLSVWPSTSMLSPG